MKRLLNNPLDLKISQGMFFGIIHHRFIRAGAYPSADAPYYFSGASALLLIRAMCTVTLTAMEISMILVTKLCTAKAILSPMASQSRRMVVNFILMGIPLPSM